MQAIQKTVSPEMDWVDRVLVSAGVGEEEAPLALEYQIIHSEDGIILSVWEPAPLTPNRVSPFMFKVNQRVESEVEAHRVLNRYLFQRVG